jgi:hypothetical protein
MIRASCHCGAVTIDVAARPEQLTSCNCSICRRLGVLAAYYPPAQIVIQAAPDATEPYIWGDKTIAHHRCKKCGCMTHWLGLDPAQQDRVGVNARMMNPADIEGVRVRRFDGADTWKFLD